ncbi:MAG TPA: hypothetical protein VFY91_10620 [Microbacterium sp.]|nr:hypothetical protein [Microbacterium sp.]
MSFSGEQWDAAPRRIVLEPGQRFEAGWRLVDAVRAVIADADDIGAPDLTIDVVRPRDLVALTVRFYGAKLTSTGAGANGDLPFVERKGSGAHVMVVEFPFQHAHEEAQYVTEKGASGVPNELGPDKPVPPDNTAPTGDVVPPEPLPVGFRPARRSRLVFAIGPSDRIEFTREGILRAIRELTPVLHPNAAPPGVRGSIDTSTFTGRLVWITPDLIARYTGEEIVLTAPTAADRRATPPPDPNSVAGALQFSESLRALRTDSANLTVRAEGRAAVGRVPNVIRDIIQRGPILGPVEFPKYSSSPTAHQTAIEAPYRLLISPSSEGRWTHADSPVPAEDTPRHVELWHSRLAVSGPGDVVTERDASRRIVRAVWTRDRDGLAPAVWRANEMSEPNHPLRTPETDDDLPFRGSLNRADRHRLVRQSAEKWTGIRKPESLRPVGVDKLWLSSLGAWLDLHGAWYTKEYSAKGIPSVLAWDHIAPLGRDQWVRVVYPGYLFPFGHACALVKITERRVTANPAIASLYQLKFLVISEPSRMYEGSDNPYIRVDLSPTTTPPIKDPAEKVDTFFVPHVAVPGEPASHPGIPLQFTGDSWDKDNRHENFRTPLFWVAEHFLAFTDVQNAYDASPHRTIPMWGQKVAYAPRTPDGDSITETVAMRWRGRAAVGSSTPYLSSADVVVDAARRLSNVPATTIIYNPTYLTEGLAGGNSGQVWAKVLLAEAKTALQHTTDPVIPAPPVIAFGTPNAGSDRSGGFVTPDAPIRGLSSLTGAVGDVAGMEKQNLNPEEFFKGAIPKLFGLVDLWELIDGLVDLAGLPNIVSETMDAVKRLLTDVQRIIDLLHEVEGQLASAAAAAGQLEAQLAALPALLTPPDDLSDIEQRITDIGGVLTAITAAIDALPTGAPELSPVLRKKLDALVQVIRTAAAAASLLDDLRSILSSFNPATVEATYRYEWTPKLFTRWPAEDITLISLPEDGFVISVEGRVSGAGEASVRAMAELRGLTLHLFGKEDEDAAPLVRIPFEHMAFIAGTDGKAEVDVVLGEITFLGVLSFVEILKEFIPFDGFSDPPFLEVDTTGLRAGFTLPIPSVSVGVFNLSNISLGADVQVPFLGESLSFGFDFCTRERPFNLSVMCIGGGGWFGIRLTPKGLEVLELGLEAGVMLAVDFGVASGSISATLGIYMRLEAEKGQLTGYFRLRGEVDVLGLISASIELYLELTYHFDSGKMIGTARLTIEVSVLCFSGSVTIECTKQFAGSKGDPSLADQYLLPDKTAPAWDDYWEAFALEGGA